MVEEIRKPPFSIKKRGFFVSASVIDKKGVRIRGGYPSLDLPDGCQEVNS